MQNSLIISIIFPPETDARLQNIILSQIIRLSLTYFFHCLKKVQLEISCVYMSSTVLFASISINKPSLR